MSLSILSVRIADSDLKKQIESILREMSSKFDADWRVSVVDAPNNDSWEVKLIRPDGIPTVKMLSGPYQHSVQAVQRALHELQYPTGKDKIELAIAKVRKQGHSVESQVHADGHMWFEIDGHMLASWQEMENLADGMSIQELEAAYIDRRKREGANAIRQGFRPGIVNRRSPSIPFLTSVRLDSFLSFPPGNQPIQLGPLNVLIGPNGSGKSNLIEALELLHSTPSSFARAIRDGGGATEWLWKGRDARNSEATLETLITGLPSPQSIPNLRYRISFAATGQRTEVTDEVIENSQKRSPSEQDVFFYYRFQNGHPVINVRELAAEQKRSAPIEASSSVKRYLQRQDLPSDESVLSQRKDPDVYPELAWLGQQFDSIQTFREWSFGRFAELRRPQPADLPTDYLLPDSRNLSLILNGLEHSGASVEFNQLLKRFLPRYERVSTRITGGNTVQFYLHESGIGAIPATRLSDGTIRFVALLALLLLPNPQPLLCIEEPELGLHPDALQLLAELMAKASKRTQIIVTTHSESLVSAFTEQTDSVMVSEYQAGTVFHRLESEKLKYWLERYRLGEIWRLGEIGGNP